MVKGGGRDSEGGEMERWMSGKGVKERKEKKRHRGNLRDS